MERRRQPWAPTVRDTAYSRVSFALTPTEDPEDKVFMETCGPWLDHPRSYPDNLRLFPSKVTAVFKAVADAPGATLVHCSGGRDRTGLITAMLLHLTGVEIAAIQENYAEAFRVASRHVARMAELHPEQTHERPYSIDEIEVRITERTEVLSAWWLICGQLDTRHSSRFVLR